MRQLDAATTVVTLIAAEAEVAGWNTEGLPRDPVSSENGAIVTGSKRWPLMIDPQLQGVAWIKTREVGHLRMHRLGQPELLPGLRAAMAGGTSVLIENMGERVDAVLLPVLQRAVLKKGGREFIALGDDETEYTQGFRLFLHTKLSNPRQPVRRINFNVDPPFHIVPRHWASPHKLYPQHKLNWRRDLFSRSLGGYQSCR